jgi:hypothetical protein
MGPDTMIVTSDQCPRGAPDAGRGTDQDLPDLIGPVGSVFRKVVLLLDFVTEAIMCFVEQGPWWAAMITWVVVNAVNLMQAIGFASRRRHGMTVNRTLGLVIAALAIPASIALVGYARAGSPWWIGPAIFDAFVALMLVVDYLRPIEFRRPAHATVLVPYLVLFFGAVLLMGLSTFQVSRALWLVTVATSTMLLTSMTLAMRHGTA